jgi:hypothetical protein
MRIKLAPAAVAAASLVAAAALISLPFLASPTSDTTATPQPAGTITVRPPSLVELPAPAAVSASKVAHALRYCGRLADEYRVPCIALYLRDAQSKTNPDGSAISNPAGPALAAECADSPGTGPELMACLTQPSL